jgi:hypothetical protein
MSGEKFKKFMKMQFNQIIEDFINLDKEGIDINTFAFQWIKNNAKNYRKIWTENN